MKSEAVEEAISQGVVAPANSSKVGLDSGSSQKASSVLEVQTTTTVSEEQLASNRFNIPGPVIGLSLTGVSLVFIFLVWRSWQRGRVRIAKRVGVHYVQS